jgi:hypothetical protein
MQKLLIAVVLLAAIPACIAMAGGAGGMGYGYQYFDSQLSNVNLGMSYITGYGYGVNRFGNRIGGFGTALLSPEDAAGGVGGLIMGQEWRAGPLVAAVTFWGGVGGASYASDGFMLVFGEADLELGVRILPWMQLVAYAGYQAWGNTIPFYPFTKAFVRTPVFGIRLGWGGMF